MAQLFPPESNAIVRTVFVAVAASMLVLPLAVWAYARSPAATGQFQSRRQPVPFAHTVHASGLRIACVYCHAGAERSASAGLPPTAACVPCHQDSVFKSNLFTAVRQSLASGQPIPWHRVNSVPDFVFFNHAAHVRNGVACDTCHGPVHLMNEVYQVAPLTMEWCVACHRNPARYMSTKETRVAGWRRGDVERGAALAAHYDVGRLTSCTTCHR
jgi:hypothetical protein